MLRGTRLTVFLLLGAVSGCGESNPLGRHAISGKVTLNGAPLENGTISFLPESQSTTSGGAMITAGEYAIGRQKGLPVGKYRVTVTAPKPGTGGQVAEDALPGDPPAPPDELIPPQWNERSEQFIDVTEKGPYVFNFDVKSKG